MKIHPMRQRIRELEWMRARLKRMGYVEDGTWDWWIDREIEALEAAIRDEIKKKMTA